jgi:peptidoglycan/xylan/chitin deacetylase (PgdA/CDA1 family)
MAELDIARPHAVLPHARRKGFLAFCALLSVLIAGLLVSPVGAVAGRRGPTADPHERRATSHVQPAVRPDPKTNDETGEPTASTLPDVAGIPGRTYARLLDADGPVRCGAGTQPLVALTFDDGPGVLTQQTVRLLRARGMTATFFLVGKLLGESRFEDLPALDAGLGTVGDHTWDHVSMLGMSQTELQAQIARTRGAISRVSGERVVLFRPPLGQHDARVDAYVRSLGMLSVLWSIDSGDSQGASADKIYRTVRESLSPGDIVLLHEGRGTTQRALPRILDLIEARGLTPVTVPQLLAQDPPTNAQLRTDTCPA